MRELTKDENRRGLFNMKSIEDLEEWFGEQKFHAISGDQIDSLDDWNQMTTFDPSADMYCYSEAYEEDGEPYVFDGESYPAVYADPLILCVEEISIDGKPTGYYVLTQGKEIIYG